MTYHYISAGEADTELLAERLGALLEPGSVIVLDGDLGAGKTRFSQGIARALGVKGIVNSPTFTLIKEYEGRQLSLYHMDVYRIDELEAGELGLDEYFYGDGVCLVEWASRIEGLLPEARLRIYIARRDDETRQFEIEPIGEPYASWCGKLKETGLL
ncbi:tRNA (adenosine(37)-N6)-threonylcarbamoyltransferase complex ATPase subunit type 1 TsaE [Paenibacillus sp. y28]|uniref:tRNA (adenosine(37)-N6)-threonylcarbamoyltransferase complex ATPase subunit type 1 TsaE n=1 Tax=Paenibacillus sp. y28 TaxID=3129110 RepID=UPI003018A347